MGEDIQYCSLFTQQLGTWGLGINTCSTIFWEESLGTWALKVPCRGMGGVGDFGLYILYNIRCFWVGFERCRESGICVW